jgi:hypothetical protein
MMRSKKKMNYEFASFSVMSVDIIIFPAVEPVQKHKFEKNMFGNKSQREKKANDKFARRIFPLFYFSSSHIFYILSFNFSRCLFYNYNPTSFNPLFSFGFAVNFQGRQFSSSKSYLFKQDLMANI